jgi:hypothetical protein
VELGAFDFPQARDAVQNNKEIFFMSLRYIHRAKIGRGWIPLRSGLRQ